VITMEGNFSNENFTNVSTSAGECKVSVMGNEVKFNYKAKNYINKAWTIAYAEIEMEEPSSGDKKSLYAFISKLESEDAITYSGTQGMMRPESKEGVRIATVDENKSLEEHYLAHLELLGKDKPIANRNELMDKIKDIPHTITDFEMESVNKVVGLIQNIGKMANLSLIKEDAKIDDTKNEVNKVNNADSSKKDKVKVEKKKKESKKRSCKKTSSKRGKSKLKSKK